MAPKTIVASGYKQVGSRATPEAITKELRKLPAAAGPLDARKRALHDLAHALAYVQEQHKTKVVETCTKEDAAALLLNLCQRFAHSETFPFCQILQPLRPVAFPTQRRSVVDSSRWIGTIVAHVFFFA